MRGRKHVVILCEYAVLVSIKKESPNEGTETVDDDSDTTAGVLI